MKKFLAFLAALLLVVPLFASALADRTPAKHNWRYIGAMRVVRCKEYVTLREEPYKKSKALAKVPLDAVVYNCRTIPQKTSFVYAEYDGMEGYILVKYLQKAPDMEPAVTSAVTQLMTAEEVAGNGEIVLDWKDYNISVIAAHELEKQGKTTTEILRIGCWVDDEPLWGHIETLEVFSTPDMLKAFIGGSEDEPMVMLYDGGYGLTMLDLLSGFEEWTLDIRECSLGNAAAVAVDSKGIIYAAGTDGPDPVAVSPDGRVIWKSDPEDPSVFGPYEITLANDAVMVKYASGQTDGYDLVSLDYATGDVIEIAEVGR